MEEVLSPRVYTHDDIHSLRKTIDANIKLAKSMQGGYFIAQNDLRGKREIALVITKLQEAKMWAGKILEETNAPFPEELRDEAKSFATTGLGLAAAPTGEVVNTPDIQSTQQNS